ncbi:MAG: hypothetical protein ACI85Q_001494 [Salibacteraceae bacterium]|jgi:hypothetical protein
MRVRCSLPLFLACSVTPMYAQESYTNKDAIRDSDIMEWFFYKTKFWVVLGHEKILLTSGVNVKMNMFKVGFQCRKNYKFGLYLGWSEGCNTFYPKLVGSCFEYAFIENYFGYVRAPITIGRGKMEGLAMQEERNSTKSHDWESDELGFFSLDPHGRINLNHWLTFASGISYRFTSSTSLDARELLSAPFYSYGVKFKLGQLITSALHHKEVNKMKSIYLREKNNLWPTDLKINIQNSTNNKA